MGTEDKEKNKAYVAKHRAMRKATEEGKKEYNQLNASYIKDHRKNLKEQIGEDEYKKQQREYMREYRKNKKAIKGKDDTQSTKAITLQSAIRNNLARKKLLQAKQEKANEVLSQMNKDKQLSNVNDLKLKLTASTVSNDILNDLFPSILNAIPEKRQRGRPTLTEEQKFQNKQARKQAKKEARKAARQSARLAKQLIGN